jgi:saccharopine dehydrogenase-like NADP-dependent oxidoreductase
MADVDLVPREALVAVLERQVRTVAAPEDPYGVEWFRVIVTGTRGGEAVTLGAELRVVEGGWEAGGGATVTGVPPSIAAQLLCRGERQQDGVGGPEAMLPVEAFFGELAGRGLTGELVEADGSRTPLHS